MNKQETLIWQLLPEHAEAWRAIRLEALRRAPEAFGSRYADWADRPLADFAARLAAGRVFAAGNAPGLPLAVAAWDRDAAKAQQGWMTSVYVTPQSRGQGFGRAVLDAVTRDAAAAGMTSLALHVVASNDAAIALYRRQGFAEDGQAALANYRGLPEITMTRDLATRSAL